MRRSGNRSGTPDAVVDVTCPWCRTTDPAYDNVPYDQLCYGHQAEYEGLTEVELERALREQYEEEHL